MGCRRGEGIFCRGGVYQTRYRVARQSPAPCARSADQPRILVPLAARRPVMTPPDDAPAVLPGAAEMERAEGDNVQGDPLWYKDAIIYQLHVKAFFDANNDGVGDFEGLTRKLDYLQDLGVTTLWLLPFYPSPLRDDGYDIADYKNIHPAYGRMGDFKAFVREAHRRKLRVITELVINHTSDQHRWFQRARLASPGSPFRDFYVWSDTDQKFLETRIIFLDTEKSNWSWDPVAQAYYWHRFYAHQPDLNFDNPRVFRAIAHVMQFWLDLGVDGMRLDAVPYLIEREGTINENLPETHEILKRLRREMDRRYGDRMLLAEANQWPEDVLHYFGAGDECHMAFHFPLMPRIYMALATEDRHPVTDIVRQTPEIPESCQWAVFLRNHDELTLEMVTDRERDYLWDYYAADRRARLNLGIRRRLAPLMENDRRKIELLKGLLLSMPGTPVLYYGDEIGMGDNVYLGDRDGVRTPMQWSPDRNGGFSRADPAMLYLPPIMDPVYGFEAVNAEAQSRSPSSLLNWTKRLIAARRARRAFGRGGLRFLYPANRKVIAYLREWQDETILCVANLSRSAQAVALDQAQLANDEPQLYLLPLAALWGSAGSELRQNLQAATLAELRQSRREGALVDAVARDGFGLALFEAIQRERSVPLRDTAGASGELRFRRTSLFAETPLPERLVARRLDAEQSNSSVLYEDYALLKLYRRLQPGPHPEVEMSRFLVERAGFANTPKPLATLELTLPGAPAEETCAAGVLFGFVRNQGDGWTLALDYLTRYLDDALNEAAPGATAPGRTAERPDPDHFFLALARQLGLRLAQMHRALAERAGDDPAFAPEPITRQDLAEWRQTLEENAERMLARLERGQAGLPEAARSLADTLTGAGPQLFRAIRALVPDEIVATKTRYHGDLHLAQVIAVQNDFYFIDFEGEPGRPLAARRRKSSPLRDVAGMIRSFDYAATAAVRELGEARPAAVPRMDMLAEAWRQRAIDGFRAAYRKAMRGCPSYPASKLQAKALIDLFTLEKAVYEVSYELANRPAWAAIPLNGILRVVEKVTGAAPVRDEHAAPP